MNYRSMAHEETRSTGMACAGRKKPSKQQLFRVKVLIEELEKMRKSNPSPKFHMKSWCELACARSRTFLNKLIRRATKNPCGTTACLAGKAGLIPKIRRMGFKWEARELSSELLRSTTARAGFKFKDKVDDNAVKEFFGIMCYWEVFMDIYGISTLIEGIKALKGFHKRESKQASST